MVTWLRLLTWKIRWTSGVVVLLQLLYVFFFFFVVLLSIVSRTTEFPFMSFLSSISCITECWFLSLIEWPLLGNDDCEAVVSKSWCFIDWKTCYSSCYCRFERQSIRVSFLAVGCLIIWYVKGFRIKRS